MKLAAVQTLRIVVKTLVACRALELPYEEMFLAFRPQ